MHGLHTDYVIAGFDGSAESRRAAWWAASEAASRHQPLVLVHAFSIALEELTRIHLPSEAVVDEPLHSAAQPVLEDLAAQIREGMPGLQVRTGVRMGHPASVLVDAAVGASVLVLGPPRLSRTRRVLLGSTADELVRTAHVPVVVVRGEHGAVLASPTPPELSHIVVGVDGSPCSTRAIGFAFDFADRHNAELVGLLVGRRDHRTGSDDARRGILSDAMSVWTERYPDVVVREEVTTAEHPADALLTAAVDADLLVVGVRGHGAVHTTCLGSVSHAVVHYAPCPVAVVR